MRTLVLTNGIAALMLTLGLGLTAAGLYGAQADGPRVDGSRSLVDCPSGARRLAVGDSLQGAADEAAPGDVLCLSSGLHSGPLEIHTPLTLVGSADAVVTSPGSGTTIRVLADGAVLDGFTVDGSGRRFDTLDAAVYVRGTDITVRDLTVRRALFGIVAERSSRLVIHGNDIQGLADQSVGVRGDGIRLWEVRQSAVTANRLTDSRDILVWYSPGNRLAGNEVTGSRYATHFMYSDDCVVENAVYQQNAVGVFVMYSRNVRIEDSLLADSRGPSGMGLGVKESGNLVVDHNQFVRAADCLYLDRSPYRDGDFVLARDNTFAGCTAAVTFHSSETHNSFVNNTFLGNQVAVRVDGRGTAEQVLWRENYFDDYQGYDLDGDGFGDVPYELRRLSEHLVARHPQLAFLRGTPALALLDQAAQVLPILQPEMVFRDPQPRVVLAAQ